MSISRVLIIYKKSLYQLYGTERKDTRFLRHLEVDPEMKRRALIAHEENQRTIETVQQCVEEMGIPYESKYRARKGRTEAYDLVITIGGDGTLLDASHAVGTTPMLGVNSSPSFSVGHFCCANAETFKEVFTSLTNETALVSKRTRLQVEIDGEIDPNPVLNEVLFSHPTPGAVTRLTIHAMSGDARYKSSGLWVSSASGSTAAMQSAGGDVMPPESTQVQYWVREPYWPPGEEQHPGSGLLESSITFTSLSRQGVMYMDGHRLKTRVGYGSKVTISNRATPLNLVCFEGRRN